MDIAYTFGTPRGDRATIYCAPEFDAPDTITMTADGKPTEFVRLSDMSLECGDIGSRINGRSEVIPVNGSCGSFDCHRRVLGQCQCGRHEAPVRFARADR